MSTNTTNETATTTATTSTTTSNDGDVNGKAIVNKLLKANTDLIAIKTNIDAQIETLITLVKNTKALNTQKESEIENQLLSMQKELNEKAQLLSNSKISEDELKAQLVDIENQVNKLEGNIKTLLDANQQQKNKIDKISNMDGGYQYKNRRSKRKLNKNNRFGVLKTKSKSKSKKGKKKRKLGKGKKSMRGGMKKRTKSKRKSKNSKKTRKRRKKNKRK